MNLNCNPNGVVLLLDSYAQLEIILNAVQFAAFNPLVDDTSCVAHFGANRSDLRAFFDQLNVAVNPNYRKGSYEAAFRVQQTES